jgi:glycosyltransferase involved in cell wall biosynthesis
VKIGIDCRMYASRFTGIGRYVYELTENLLKLDHENEYVFFFNHPEYESFHPRGRRVQKVLVNSAHYSFSEQTVFLYHLYKANLDLMHFTHFNAPILYRRPSVVTIHDLTLSFFPGRKMTSALHRIGYHFTLKSTVRKAKKIISVSQNTKKDLEHFFRVPSGKISVIYAGVNGQFKPIKDKAKLSALRQKFHLDKPYLLYTGVWRTHKNLPNLIRAFHILKQDHHFEGYLVITGREDPLYGPEIRKEIESLKLQNDVIFPGLVDEKDLVLLYNGAVAYVFPSLYEGFGLPPLEAMQCGIPVAASNVSSIPEICGQDNALFFNPEDPQNIAATIFRILSQKSLRKQLIENGFKRVKNFSWEKMAREILKLYKKAAHVR